MLKPETPFVPSLPSSGKGEVFAFQLRLHPLAAGSIWANSGPQIQAAFLNLVRQVDPVLADALHAPNQRRPYTLGRLQGFNHLSADQQIGALDRGAMLAVHPGQVYWLRLTTLDERLFDTFTRALLFKAQELVLSIGETRFTVSRIVTKTDAAQSTRAWVASSSFADLSELVRARETYQFEFASPTVFSRGNRSWGKYLYLFPEPSAVFESVASQWENFAPPALRLITDSLTPHQLGQWCTDAVVVSQYTLTTSHIHAKRFGQVGFQGTITYEVKGDRAAPEARWLTTMARFAFFSGVGYKTTMGMGQARCLSLPLSSATDGTTQEEREP